MIFPGAFTPLVRDSKRVSPVALIIVLLMMSARGQVFSSVMVTKLERTTSSISAMFLRVR